MISGAATAALVEPDPGRGARAALFAGLAQAGGSAAGPLLGGVLAERAPAPRVLPYVAALAATVVAAGFVLRLRDLADRRPEPWRIDGRGSRGSIAPPSSASH
jgi:MFS family permease